MYPIFAKFRGGKAVATSAGVLLCYSPVVFAILAVVFFSLLFTTRYVSLSSMVTAVVAVIASIVSGDKIFIIAMCLLAGMVIYKHRANIGRIINKTEPKANFSKSKNKIVTHITQKENVKHINSVFCVIFYTKEKAT